MTFQICYKREEGHIKNVTRKKLSTACKADSDIKVTA